MVRNVKVARETDRNMKTLGIAIWVLATFLISPLLSAAEVGKPAPDIQLPKLNESNIGDSAQISDFRGKLVYLDFWASWCGPCRKSFPVLNELHNTYNSLGFEVVAINVDENLEDALGFLEKHPVDYTILLDSEAISPQKFNVPGMPTAYIIDAEGNIIHRHVGFRNGDAEKIEKLINELLIGT